MTATIVVDLGFGDAGKGSIVDYLTRSSKIASVVRFNGGAQAAHNVITPSGQHHTFSQFGSGTLMGARTFLSRFMLVDPPSMVNEANHLRQILSVDPFSMLAVDEDALVVSLFHKLANRQREIERGDSRHGSCGMGIGEAMRMDLEQPDLSIRIGDLRSPQKLWRKLRDQRDHTYESFPHSESLVQKISRAQHFDEMFSAGRLLRIVDRDHLKHLAQQGDLIFEGAQGVLLDETFGFHPYTTWSTCTFRNADTLLADAGYADSVIRLGVMRAYMVRHGQGPFPTENRWIKKNVPPEQHNCTAEWQGEFRFGNFDAVLARYAIEVCGGIDKLAITNIDRLKAATRVDPQACVLAAHYRYNNAEGVYRTSRLAPLSAPNLRAQRGLTHFLNQCSPEYRLGWPVEGGPHGGFLGLIEKELGMPITIKSYGPTADDKLTTE